MVDLSDQLNNKHVRPLGPHAYPATRLPACPSRFNDLKLAAVARSFCLLRLPKIAELSDPSVAESFEKEKTVDFTAIK